MPEAARGPAPPSLEEARGWLGFELDDFAGARVGRARGLFADAADGRPSWLVVVPRRRLALFGRRRAGAVVVPLRDCAAAAGRIWAAHAGEAIRSAPTVDPSRPLLREHELAICAHYGIGERVGRAAEASGRAAGSITAQPV